jgi:IclR family KDG regulon transcriptional repressor
MKTNENKENGTSYRVQSLERALDILECFSFQKRDLSLSDIVRLTGLNKTTVKRIAANLVSRGYLQLNSGSKYYKLGMRLFEFGGIVFSSLSLRESTIYPMSRLQKQTDATVLLGVEMDDQLVYIDKREGGGMIRILSDVGFRRPLHYGMLGMTLMAHLDPQRIRNILKKMPLQIHTPYSITDIDAFGLRLEKIRKNGYLLEREEAVEGIIGIAAPIRDYSRQVVAAVGIAISIALRHSEKELNRLTGIVRTTADEISDSLGYLKI